jgi:ketosteroid isomerase-like protein
MDISIATNPPRTLIARYHRAMLDKNADALAELYAVDGVHEFPLFSPFFPRRLNGRDEIRKHYTSVWGAAPFRILDIRQVAIHETHDPNVLVSEAEFTARATATDKTFALSFAVVMCTKDGFIVHLRDYMDALGAAVALDRLPAMVEVLQRRRAERGG